MSAALPVQVAIPSLAMNEAELIGVLGNSIYPGAKAASIKLVIGYCKARQLDPLQKPVHIVPMSVKVGKKPSGQDEYEWRDVVMPGIGLYRTDAARTGLYAGKTEPEFGPDKQLTIGDFVMTYPEWCRLTVYRIVNGERVGFTAKELWLENYATAGRDTRMPNAMWKRRPYAQLAKCAEAQALRMAFPEAVGAEPTAEEMEGKTIDGEGHVVDEARKAHEPIPALLNGSAVPAAAPANPQPPSSPGTAEAGGGGAETEDKALTDGERNHLKAKLAAANLSEVDLKAKFGCDIATLKASQFKTVKTWIAQPSG